MVNLPNKITFFRIFMIPVFVILIYINKIAATIIFLFLMATDLYDGYLARKNKQITVLGKFLDPLADKFLITSALIFLIGNGIEPWMAFLIIAREYAVLGLRTIAVTKNVVIAASWLGKAKTFSQTVGIVFVLLGLPFAFELMVVAVILTIVSGADYFYKGRRVLIGK